MLLTIVLGFGFIGWVFWFAGTTIAAQFEALRLVVTAQFDRLMEFVASLGLMPKGPPQNLGIAAARLGRAADQRRRQRRRRDHQPHR